MAANSGKMPEGTKGLLETGYFSNLTLEVGPRTWAVHKAIICPQSGFFLEGLYGTKPAGGTIKLDDEENTSSTVAHMISYLYTQTYEPPTAPPEDATFTGIGHAAVYNIADKYDVPGLTALAAKRFEPCARADWDAPNFALCIEEIFRYGPRASALKHIVFDVAAEHAGELFGASADRYEDFHKCAAAFPEFVRGVCKAVVARQKALATTGRWGEKRYRCRECSSTSILEMPASNQATCFACGVDRHVSLWEVAPDAELAGT